MLPFFSSRIPAGFPSPAEDHVGVKLDLNKLLLPHPSATYIALVEGNSMTGGEDGIRDGSLIAVDCRLTPQHDDVIIAVVEGQHTVKRLIQRGPDDWLLVPDNPAHPSIRIGQEPDLFDCWGVVMYVVNGIRRSNLAHYVRVS